jgi:hypothetical protein
VGKIHANLPLEHSFNSRPEQPVFVPIGEFVQDAEQRGQLGVWAIVRLVPLNLCPNWIAYRPKLHSTDDSVIKLLFSAGDRELGFPFIGGRARKSLVTGYGIYEMVQTATKGIDAIRNSQGPLIERRRLIDANNNCASGVLSVHLLDDAIRISLTPGLDFITDGLSVFRAVG